MDSYKYNFNFNNDLDESFLADAKAKELARRTNAVFVRIDTVEQGLKDICKMEQVEGEGYRLSYRICKDNLLCGNNVIADSVNPIKICRDEWH